MSQKNKSMAKANKLVNWKNNEKSRYTWNSICIKKTNAVHLMTPNFLPASSYASQVNQSQSIESILMSDAIIIDTLFTKRMSCRIVWFLIWAFLRLAQNININFPRQQRNIQSQVKNTGALCWIRSKYSKRIQKQHQGRLT